MTQSFTYNGKKAFIEETNNNWSKYKSLTFKIRNNSNEDIKIKSFEIVNGNNQKYIAALDATNHINTTIKADGNCHTVTVDLNNIYWNGILLLKNNSFALEKIKNFSIKFSSKGETDLSIDDFEFNSSLDVKVTISLLISHLCKYDSTNIFTFSI